MCNNNVTVEVRLNELIEEAKGYKTIVQFLNDVGGVIGRYIADWKVNEHVYGSYNVLDPEGDVIFTVATYGAEELVTDVLIGEAIWKYANLEEELEFMKCPICECGNMEYRSVPNPKANNLEKVTHIWVCDECPNVMIEWYDHSDTEALAKGLN